MRTVVWRGLDEPRMELARVEISGSELGATGTQIGVAYELRYELERESLRLEVVGDRRLEVALGGLDFFDLGNSPLFNSLPVLRDGLLEAGDAHEYLMRWVSVPDLAVHEQRQRYEPIGAGVVRFRTGSFTADIEFDADGVVGRYEGLAERLA
ncbi:MAG: putative glycolipid-binding domain-containing protein [Gaiellaceae bacterium]